MVEPFYIDPTRLEKNGLLPKFLHINAFWIQEKSPAPILPLSGNARPHQATGDRVNDLARDGFVFPTDKRGENALRLGSDYWPRALNIFIGADLRQLLLSQGYHFLVELLYQVADITIAHSWLHNIPAALQTRKGRIFFPSAIDYWHDRH